VRPLKLNPADPKVPEDCKVLVVTNPKSPVPIPLEREILAYLSRPNAKAIFLLDVAPAGDEKVIPPTGLEAVLGEYGVEVTNAQIVSAVPQGGGVAAMELGLLEVNESLTRSGNELARAFVNRQLILPTVRVVRPMGMGRDPSKRAEPLLVTGE